MESVRFLDLSTGATLRKGGETLFHPLPFTALYWGPVPKILSIRGGRKCFSVAEIPPKMFVTGTFTVLHGAWVFQGPPGEGDIYEKGNRLLTWDTRLLGK